MNIQHHHDPKGGSFYYEAEGRRLAEMVYVMAGNDKMIIEHTEVDESLKGQGVGKVLLENLVAFVRENGIRVVPLCPFTSAMFKRNLQWQDVLVSPS